MEVNLPAELEKAIEERVQAGEFASAEAFMRQAAQQLLDHQRKLQWLRAEVQKGLDDIEAGRVVELDADWWDAFRKDIRDRAEASATQQRDAG